MISQVKGLTIIELLIALTVIAIVFLALLSGHITSLRTTAGAREVADAKTFANRTLENVRASVLKDLRVKVAAATTDADKEKAWNDAYYVPCPGVTNSEPPVSGSRPSQCVTDGTVSPVTNSIYAASWVLGPSGANPPAVENEGLLQVNIRIDWSMGGDNNSLTIIDYISCSEVDLDACPTPLPPSGHL